MKRVSSSASIPARLSPYRDPRFLVGVILVVGSIILSATLINMLNTGARVYRVTSTVNAGETITADKVEVVTLRVDTEVYLPASELQPEEKAARVLQPGYILAREDIATTTTSPTRGEDPLRVSVTIASGLPSGIEDGSHVRIWRVSTRRSEQQSGQEAKEIKGTFIYAGTLEATSSSARRGTRIELLVSADAIEDILGAEASTDELTIIPVRQS